MRTYELAGGETLDYCQVADLFTEVLGRKITYRNPNLFQFVRAWRSTGLPLRFVLVIAFLYTSTCRGMAAEVAEYVEDLLGRQAITMRQHIKDYAATWLPDAERAVVEQKRQAV